MEEESAGLSGSCIQGNAVVADAYKDKILDTVYIGGGTPTTLEAGQLDWLLTKLKNTFDWSQVKEFTVEAGRADSITPEKLAVLHQHGVTRISVNPQTMKDETLKIHRQTPYCRTGKRSLRMGKRGRL